jgi:hypothetical protein
MDWYAPEYGGGVMIVAEKFGPIFLHDTENEQDLIRIATQEGT